MKLYNSLTFQKVNTPQCWKATHNPFVTSQRVVGTSSRLVAVALWSRPEVDCHEKFGQVERKDFFKKCLLRKAVNRGLRRLFSGICCIWCHTEPFQNSCYGPANRQPTTSTSSDSDSHDFSHVASALALIDLFHPVLFLSFVFFSLSPYNFPRKRFHAAAWVFEWWSNGSVGGDNPRLHHHYPPGTAAGVPLSKGKPGCRSAGTHQTVSMCCPLVVECSGVAAVERRSKKRAHQILFHTRQIKPLNPPLREPRAWLFILFSLFLTPTSSQPTFLRLHTFSFNQASTSSPLLFPSFLCPPSIPLLPP